MRIFSNLDDAATQALKEQAALFIVHFMKLKRSQQQQHIMEWLRYAPLVTAHPEHAHCRYPLPLLSDEEEDDVLNDNECSAPLVCKSFMIRILGKKIDFWKTCENAVNTNTITVHGNTNNSHKSREFSITVGDDLHLYFAELKLFAEPTATLYVREETGTGLRDNEIEKVCLPP